jgi:hypothetical protein
MNVPSVWKQYPFNWGPSSPPPIADRKLVTMESQKENVVLYIMDEAVHDKDAAKLNTIDGIADAAVALDLRFTMANKFNSVKPKNPEGRVGFLLGATEAELKSTHAEFLMFSLERPVDTTGMRLSAYHVVGNFDALNDTDAAPLWQRGESLVVGQQTLVKSTSIGENYICDGMTPANANTPDNKVYPFRVLAGPKGVQISLGDKVFSKTTGATSSTSFDTTKVGGAIQKGFAFFSTATPVPIQFGNIFVDTPSYFGLNFVFGYIADSLRLHSPCGGGFSDDCGSLSLVCDTTTHTCKAAIGGTCGNTGDCRTGLECPSELGQCRKTVGADCDSQNSSTTSCGPLMSCDTTDSKCYDTPRKIGQPCSLTKLTGHMCGLDNDDDAAANGFLCVAPVSDAPSGTLNKCGCNADGGFVKTGDRSCGQCVSDAQCGIGGTCKLQWCECDVGLIKGFDGKCTRPTTNKECTHGTIRETSEGNVCDCLQGFAHNAKLGGCRACDSPSYVRGRTGPEEPDGTCVVPQTCSLANLVSDCNAITTEGVPDGDPRRVFKLYSNSGSLDDRSRLVRDLLPRLVSITGTMTLEIHLDDEDNSVDIALANAPDLTVVVYGNQLSSAAIAWRVPHLKAIKELRLENSWITRLPPTAFPELHTVTNLRIAKNSRLISADLPKLNGADNSIIIAENPQLESLQFPTLNNDQVNEVSLDLRSSPSLIDKALIPGLEHINNLMLSLPDRSSSGASLAHLEIEPIISRILPKLTTLSSLTITDTAMKSCDMSFKKTSPYAMREISTIKVTDCPQLEWIAIPSSSVSTTVKQALRFERNPNLQAVYDAASEENSAVNVTAYRYGRLHARECPKLSQIATCSVVNVIDIQEVSPNEPKLCCSSLRAIVGSDASLIEHYFPNSNPKKYCRDCDLSPKCDASTNKFQPVVCTAIVHPIGPLKCHNYASDTALVFDSNTPLSGGNKEFLQSLERIETAHVIIQDTTQTGELHLPNLELMRGKLQLIGTKYSHFSAPSLRAFDTRSDMYEVRIEKNANLQTLSLPQVCMVGGVFIENNDKLVFTASDMCRDGTWASEFCEIFAFITQPASLGSLATLEAFINKFYWITRSVTVEGNAGCRMPEANCRVLSTNETMLFDANFVANNAKFLSSVREIRCPFLSFGNLPNLPKLPRLHTVHGVITIANSGERTAGFMPALDSILPYDKDAYEDDPYSYPSGLFIEGNPNMKSLKYAFKSLTSITTLRVKDNAQLNDDLAGFRALRVIKLQLSVIDNPKLQSIKGLAAVTSRSLRPGAAVNVEYPLHAVSIHGNNELQSLSGVEDIVCQQYVCSYQSI